MPFSDSTLADPLYHALFDASPNLYLVLDRRLHIAAANRAYLASTQRTLDDIVGRWAWDAFPTDPVTLKQAIASFERVIALRAPDTMALLRFDVPRPGGAGMDTRYWSITHTPVFNPAGDVEFVIQHPIDVTEIERRRLAAGRSATRAGDQHPAMLAEQTGLFDRARDVFEQNLQLQAAEGQLAFQLELADGMRALRSSDDIRAVASRMVGQKLGIDRVAFAQCDAAAATVTVARDWCAPGWASLAGTVLPLQAFGAGAEEKLRAGRAVAVEDSAPGVATRLRDHHVGARLTLPLLRGGVLRGLLMLHCAQPRHWSAYDMRMAQDMAERTWTAIDAATAQEALLDAADTLRFTHESARLGDWETDLATGVSRRSLRHDECFGYTEPVQDWQYCDFMGHVHPDDRAMVDRDFREAIAEKKVWQTECRVVWPDASEHWIAIFGSVHMPAHDVDGAPDKIAGIVFDITERKHAEEEMRLEARRKDEFLAMLAHELRNPLAPIAAAAGILSLGRSDAAQVRKTSAVITRQVNHITSLINDLLDVSRVTRGLVALDSVPVDVKAAVADAVEQVRPLVETRYQRLEVELAPEHALVLGDKKRLVQVLSNLLNNAAKYTPEHGRIRLLLEVHPDEVVLCVSDDGIGMTLEVQQNVFGLFTQAERTADRSQGGLGIGLALVKSLVELHHGTVSVHSEGLGLGSKFSLHLPRLMLAAPPMAPGETLPAAAIRARLHVLVVDDNVDAAQLMAMFLETNGFDVAVEHDAVRALALAASMAPDVCLLDIGLPGMDGNELARRLRRMPQMAGATLVAITGYGQQQDRDAAFDAGFDHHFVKPVGFDKLLAVLGKLALIARRA